MAGGPTLTCPSGRHVAATPGSVFFAHSAPPRSSARIFRGQTEQPLEQDMLNVIEGFRAQGARDFTRHPVPIASGFRLL